MAQYRAVVGIDYPPNKRVEAGEIVSDLPGDSIKWLLEQNLIETLDKKSTPKETPVVEKTVKEVIEKPVVEITPEYKADAEDGDNDGLIQDGTAWERPVGTKLSDEEITKIVKGGE